MDNIPAAPGRIPTGLVHVDEEAHALNIPEIYSPHDRVPSTAIPNRIEVGTKEDASEDDDEIALPLTRNQTSRDTKPTTFELD